jgi:hypothetical protein
MNKIDMRARMERLAKLAQGLAEEVSIWKKCDAPGALRASTGIRGRHSGGRFGFGKSQGRAGKNDSTGGRRVQAFRLTERSASLHRPSHFLRSSSIETLRSLVVSSDLERSSL